jgi:hypothetical protein
LASLIKSATMGLRFVSKMRVLSLLGLIASCCCAHTSAFSTTSGVTGAIAASRSKIQVPLYTRNSRPGKTYVNAGMSTFGESLALHAEASSSSSSALVPSKVLKAAKSLHRISWLSWWSQVILTTISAVTLLFARSVGAAGKNNLTQRVDGSFLAGTGRFFFTTSSICNSNDALLNVLNLKRMLSLLSNLSFCTIFNWMQFGRNCAIYFFNFLDLGWSSVVKSFDSSQRNIGTIGGLHDSKGCQSWDVHQLVGNVGHTHWSPGHCGNSGSESSLDAGRIALWRGWGRCRSRSYTNAPTLGYPSCSGKHEHASQSLHWTFLHFLPLAMDR